MDPIEFGEFDLVLSNGNISGGASALQWGADGLLYVVGRNGFVYAIEVDKQTNGQGETTGYSGEIKWTHDLSAPNFDDDGNLVSGGSRQALGIVVTEDEATGETIVYASHSDIKIGAGGGGGSGDIGLDTNSGVVTRIKLSIDGNKDVTENEAIDLIRGLPRSEENHATNGLALTTDDEGNPILLIASGGHANAGAPSINFVGLPEYTYSAAVLSADLNQLAAIEAAKKSVDPNIDHVFDLPTLDDPTRPNFTDADGDVKIDANFDGVEDSVAEFVDQNSDGIPDWMVDQDGDGDVDSDDVADFVATKIVDTNNDGVRDTILYQDGGSAGDNVTGVRGGNDGLNQAKLLVGNPVQIYSSGYRNTYDVLVTEDGRKYTYDNGANGGWGGVAVTDNGVVTNEPNNVNETQNFDQLHEFDEGTHSGHPNPTVASGSAAGLWTSPTQNGSNSPLPIANWRELSDTPLPSIGQEDDGLVLPADWDEIVDPELINPAAGIYNEGGTVADGALDSDKGSWNGLAEYTGTAFGGQLQGAILVTQTGGDVKWIKRDVNGNIEVVAAGNGSLSDPNTIVEAADQGLVGDTNKGNTLGIDAVGDSGVDGLGLFNNTIWVGSLGGTNKITIYEAGGEPAGADLDKDDDGIDHVADYYEFSDTQGVDHVLDDLGTTTTVNAGETRVYNLSAESYSLSAPGGIGQLGYMVNLTDPSAEGGLLSADENIIPGGAGSGLQIKDIRSGTAKGADNDQKDALTFAVTPGADAGRLEISTTMNAILTGFYQDGSEAGLQIGTGDQFSFMSLVLAYSGSGTLNMVLHYEEGDAQQATQSIDVSGLLENIGGVQRLPDTTVVEFLFDVDTTTGIVTPKFKIINDPQNPPADFTEMAPVQATGDVLDAIQGNFEANGVPHPLAFGNIGTSAIDPDAQAQAVEEDNVNVTYDEFKVVGFAPNVDAFVVLTGADATVSEDAGTVALALELQDEFGTPVVLTEDVTVNFSVGGSATSPDDFGLSATSPVIIPAGTSSVPLTVNIVDDEDLETDETVEITLGAIAANGLAVIAKATADSGTITIESDDSGNILYRVNAGGPEIASLDGGPNWASDTEGANNPNLLDAGSNNTNGFAVVPGANVPDRVPDVVFETERWENAGGASMEWGFDVDPGVYEVNLYVGNGFGGTSEPGARVFDVAIEGAVLENTDNIDLSAQFGHLVGGVITATVEVTDGQLNLEFLHVTENPLINAIEIIGPPPAPTLPQVSLATDAVAVNEADGSISLTVETDTQLAANDDVTVTFEIASGTATSEADFDFDGSTPTGGVYTGTVIIPGGTSENSIDIDILQDTDIEPSETFTVTITGVSSNAEIAPENSTVVTITDDDTPAPQPGDVLYRVNAGTDATIASTDGGPDWIGDVNLIGANATGAELSGNTADTFSNQLTDAEDEVDLTNLENAVPWELFVFERGDNTVDATTLDYSFDVTPGTTYEVTIYYTENWNNIFTGGPRIFDVEVEGAVPVEFADIHPLREITDIIDGPEAPLPDFPTGNQPDKQPYLGTALSRTVTVTAQDSELNLSFIHNDPVSQNPKINAIEIKVADDTSTQDVTITAQDISADESTGEITITFEISETVTDGDITIPFTLVSGTATIGTDTTPNQDGSVTFPAGDGSEQTVVITLVNDDLVEGDESFTVQLGAPTAVPANVNVTTVDGTATILDDDVATPDSFNGTDAPGGDWSNSNTAPDDVALVEGTNTLVSTGEFGDSDYITFTVAEGQQVTSITLADYVGGGNAAFLGIQVGDSVPTQGEIEGGSATLDGGTVFNVAQLGNDILPLLASTSVENAGQPTNGFATPLQAGTYTLWFNQNQDLTETTLEIVSEAVPGPDVTIAIADAPTVEENGDVADTILAFVLTASDENFAGDVTITYEQNGQVGFSELVSFTDGAGTLSVIAGSDDVNTGDTVVSITLTGADDGGTTSLGIDEVANTADGTITEDDTSAFIGADIEVGDVVLAINSGPGGAITNDPIFGIDFKADEQFVGGSNFNDGQFSDNTGDNPALDGSILETERFNDVVNYTLTQLGDGTPLVAGEVYVLDLILTELFQDTAGIRIFDIVVNGETLVDDLDLVAKVGVDDQATSEVEGIYRLRTTVTVNENGQILIELPASADNGKLNGLILFQPPVADGIISIADAPTLVESGDTDATTLVFPLSITGPDPVGPVTIDYTVDGAPASADVTFSGGTATLEVAVPNDDEDNGTETVTVALTGVPGGFTIDSEASSASGAVTEDDAPNPDDIDEDGILNTDDPFAYDGTNGDAKSLATAGEFLQDFNTDTTDPFSPEGGFSGIITNPAFNTPGTSASDPYGDRTTEATTDISGGFLNVTSSETDLFGGAAQNPNNNIKDNYQSAVDVTGVAAFEVVARAVNPFFGGDAPEAFASFGITIGAGGVNDYIKLVFGGSGNGPRIEMAGENSILGGADTTLASAEIDPNAVAEVEFRLFVDTAAGDNGQVQGTVTFFDNTGAEIGSIDTNAVNIDPAGSLLAALNGQNPLTGGDGGLAYGISITDWGGADSFTGSWDFLRITSLDAPADETPPVASFDVVADITDADAPIIVTATITDETALDDSSVEQGDVTLLGPGVTDQAADAFSFIDGIASWTFDAPVDGWENGDFTATLAAGSVLDDAGNLIAETSTTATVAVPEPVLISISDAAPIQETGDEGTVTPVVFDLQLSQPQAVTLVLGLSVVINDGPAELIPQTVTFDETGAGQFTLNVPNDDEDNGTISIEGTLVVDQAGFAIDSANAVATATVTEDDVVTDVTPPTGVIATIDALSDTSAPIVVEVAYADDVELDTGSIDETDLSLTGPGLAAPVNATSVSFEPTTGVATYTFDAPAGGWDEGTFDVALVVGSVTDTAGNGVAASSATVVVDEPLVVSLVQPTITALVEEDEDAFLLTVQLSETSTETVIVNYEVTGTATDGADYRIVPPTIVEIAPGETEGTLILEILNDTEFEEIEDFTVTLTSTTQGQLDPVSSSASFTIESLDPDVPPPTGDPIMLEAEDFTGINDSPFFVQAASDASENELIRLGSNTDVATVETELPDEVTPGVYTVAVTYFDESDGQSSASIAIDGTTVGEWDFNKDGPSNAAQGANLRTVVFENVQIGPDAIFSLTGDRDDDEFVRIDKVTFTKTGELPDGDPPVGTDIPDLVEVAAGEDVDIAYSYSDPDGGAVTVAAELSDGNALPEWLTVTDTGLAGTPPPEAIGQSFEITLTVEDDEGDTLVDTFTLSLLAPVDETGPTAAISGVAPATPFDDLVLTVTLVDPAGIDEATIDDTDLVVTGPSGALPAGTAGVFDAIAGTVTYTFAAPATGWETGSYTASFAAGAVADQLANLSSAAADFVLPIQGDDTAPVPSVAAGEPVDANSPIIVTVTLDEAFDIDEATVEATDLTLTGPDGAATQAAGSPVFDAVAKTVTFTFDAPAGGWSNGAYQAALGDGAVSDAAGNPSDPVVPFDFAVTTGVDPAVPGANLDEDFDEDGTINSEDGDIDEDGIANLADRFAYDATNQGEDLSAVGQIEIGFDGLDVGDSPFTAGFTGVLPAAGAAVVEIDYATNNGAAVVDTPNGKRLQFETTGLDTDDGQTALTFGAQVEEDFTFSGTFDNPYFGESGEVPNNFEQYGLILGFSGTDFLKLVAGSPGNAFEISGDIAGAGIGTDDKVGLPAGVAITDYAQVELTITGEVSPGGVTLTGEFVLLDTAGQSIGSGIVGTKTITSGPIFDAIVNGTGGPVAFGVTSTHFGGGADPFTVSVEQISLVATDLVDVEGPTAVVSVEDIADANSDIVVEVTFADDTGVDTSTVDGDEIVLTSNAGDSFPAPTIVDNGGGSYTYTFVAPAGGWQGTSFTAALAAGTVADTSPDANANDAGAPVTFAREDIDPVDQILANLTGVDTGGDYGAGATGSVILTIMDGVNNVKSSNFGANSFELHNTGDKQVAAVFIDVRDALYGDSVFDFDGSGGDTTTKPFVVNSETGNGTGGFFEGVDSYFLPGTQPIDNTTGFGIASSGGFDGLLIKFSGDDGGFANGEAVGFSGDMDPNSIAGITKAAVDTGAIDGWDVGGVSGAELIGSKFIVVFDDGTTAEGYLHSDNSLAGSVGEAVQGRAGSPVSVTVNGFDASDNNATYGGTEPVIIVTGTPGETVRVVMTQGLNPVQNENGGVADIVADRLEATQPDFQVNNAANVQTIDLVIGDDGTVTVPQGAFDYNATPGNVSFPDISIAPMAVAAAVIDDSTDSSIVDQIAIGPVSDPVYLTNPTGTPVDPDIPVITEVYLAENGTVVFEAEDADRSGTSGWLFETVAEAVNENPDPQGEGYIIWEGGNSFGNPAPNSTLNYTFQTDEGGNYTLKGMFGRRNEPDTTEANDVFVRLVDSQGNPVDPVPQTQGGQLIYHVQTGEAVPEDEFTEGNTNIVLNNPEKWMKFYISGVGLNQLNGGGLNGDNGGINVVYALDPNETYTLQVAGRSNDFEIDRWALSNDGAGAATNAAENGEASEKTVVGPSEPVVDEPIPDQSVEEGEALSFTIPAGTFDDADGDVLTLTAPGLPAGFSFDGATLTAPGTLAPGDYDITIVATDDDNNSVSDTFTVTVTDPLNTVPTVDVPIADQNVTEGQPFSFTVPAGTFDDLDGDELTLTAPTLPAGFSFNGTTVTAPGTLAIGDYDITIVATDDDGNSVSDTFAVSVIPEPESNIIINLVDPVTDQVIRQLSDDDLVNFSELSTGQYAIEAVFDGNGDDSMQFFIDGNLVATENNPPYTLFGDNGGDFGGVDLPAEGESLTFSVSAFSGGSGSGELLDTRTITIFFGEGELPNRAPEVIAPVADDTVDFEESVSIDVTGVFSDPDQDDLTLEVNGLPQGLGFDGSTISGQPTEDGTFTVTVSASDGEFTTTDTFELTVLPDGGTIPFADVDIPDQNVQEGEAFSFAIPGNAFDDLDGDVLTLTAPGLPAGFGFNGTTVTAPGTLALGDYDITIVATDDDGNSASQTFTVTVTPEPDTIPTVDVPISDQSIEAGQPLNFTIPGNAFDDEDGDILTLTAPDLPAGFGFDGSTLTSSGTLAPGDYDITIVATDDDGNSVDQTFTVTVTPPNLSNIQLLLINPQTNQVIRELSVTDIIATDELPSGEYNIQAVYTPGGEESAVFSINGQEEQTESGAPYALFSDNGGFFNGEDPESPGTVWSLTVEIFSENSGNGTLLDSQTFTLTFAETSASAQAAQSGFAATGFALDDAPSDTGEEDAGPDGAELSGPSASNFAASQQVEQISLLQGEEEGPTSEDTGTSDATEKAPMPDGIQLLGPEDGSPESALSGPAAHNNKADDIEVPLPDAFDFGGLSSNTGSSTLNDMLDMIDAVTGGDAGAEEPTGTSANRLGLGEDDTAPDPTWSKLDEEGWDTPG